MKRNFIGTIFILLLLMVSDNKIHSCAPHALNLNHEVRVEKDNSSMAVPLRSISRYTPPAPYNNVTFTIIAPVKVSVGQTFTIDYAIHASKFTYISYWADLIPDNAQGPSIKLIDVSNPTHGVFNADEVSRANNGGKGAWKFAQGLPASTVQHLRVTVQATAPGLLKFATVAATNPPSYLSSEGTLVCSQLPLAEPISVKGVWDQPLEISLLDYVTADSPLQITSITNASYGSAHLNNDYTVTYIPSVGFYGNDSFSYKISDAAGNVIDGTVSITIDQAPVPQIIK